MIWDSSDLTIWCPLNPDPKSFWPKTVTCRDARRRSKKEKQHKRILAELRGFDEDIKKMLKLLEAEKPVDAACSKFKATLNRATSSARLFMLCTLFDEKTQDDVLESLELGRMRPFDEPYKITLKLVQSLIHDVRKKRIMEYEKAQAKISAETVKKSASFWARTEEEGSVVLNGFSSDNEECEVDDITLRQIEKLFQE